MARKPRAPTQKDIDRARGVVENFGSSSLNTMSDATKRNLLFLPC